MTEPIDDGGEHPVVPWLNQRRRAWLYRVSGAGIAGAVGLGLIGAEQAAAALGLVSALLSTGLAIKNTSTKEP